MILRLNNSTTEMKNLTTGILCMAMLCFFTISSVSAQNSWDDDTFMIRFDSSITQSEIDFIKADYYAEELWISPITQTRLWKINAPFPHTTQYTGDYFVNIAQNSTNARGKAGSQGGAGNNYKVPGNSGGGLNFNGNQGGSPGPINPNPTNPDNEYNCHGESFTKIATGDHPVKLGIYDTGLTDLTTSHDFFWHYAINLSGYNYISNNYNYTDDQGHGNHVGSTIFHLVNHAYATGVVLNKPNVTTRIMKTFDANAFGYVAEIIFALETEAINGMQIANFSWRFTAEVAEAEIHPLKKTLEELQNQYDVLMICAAGNDGENIDFGIIGSTGSTLNAYPASYDFANIISVTTFDCENSFPEFANIGAQTVDIAAPGIEIPGMYNDLNITDVDFLTGTSMSSAIVAATAVKLATHLSTFDAQQIKCAIMTGSDYHHLIAANVVSSGVLNSETALNELTTCLTGGGNGGPNGRFVSLDQGDISQVVAGIYPNPSYGDFDVSLSSKKEMVVEMSVFNTMGQLIEVKSSKLYEGDNTINFNLSDLSPGLYQVTIESDKFIIASEKITILK